MNYQTIELILERPVAVLSLNRPNKLNAINKTMLEELDSALDEIENNEDIYAMVLRGNGRAFCAGFDLQAGIDANRKGEKQWRAALQYDLDVIMRFWYLSKPTIAAVHGYVLAGGFELALACDMTICGRGSQFGEPEVQFGSSIVALLLPWYTNPKRAKKVLLTGQNKMNAEEAFQLGIVNEVVDDDEVFERGLSLANEVALMDPDSVRLTKRAINESYEIMGMRKALSMGVDTSVEIETTESPLRKEFNQVFRSEGLKAAVAWREQRLKNT